MSFNFELDYTNSNFFFYGCFFSIPLMDYLLHHGLEYSLPKRLKVRVGRIRCVVVMNTYVKSQYAVPFLVFNFLANFENDNHGSDVIQKGGIHDVTVLLIYCYQKHFCQCIASIKWVNGMREICSCQNVRTRFRYPNYELAHKQKIKTTYA